MKISDLLSNGGSETMAPRWDGKIFLAAIFIVGYYALIFRISGSHPVPVQNAQMIRDGMLVLGPPIGVIVGSLFRTTGADERANARRSDELKTAMATGPAIADAAVSSNGLATSVSGQGGVAPPEPAPPAARPYEGPPAVPPQPAHSDDLPETPSWPS